MAAGFVYLMRNDANEYKIGITRNVPTQHSSIRSKTKRSIDLLKIWAKSDARKVEKKLHEKFRGKRIRGEWLSLSDEDVAEFDAHVANASSDMDARKVAKDFIADKHGETFRRIRLASGLSVEQVAKQIGISRQGLHIIETGQRGASFETARRFVKAMGESLAVFD